MEKDRGENIGQLFDAKRGPKPVDSSADPERLYAKIGQSNMELEWLKKSPASTTSAASKLDAT